MTGVPKLWLQALALAIAHEPPGGISTTLLFILFKDPPYFLFVVTQCVNTKCKDVSHLTVLPGNRVVVCCKKHEQWKLAVYDIQSGTETMSLMLSELPSGMSSVLLDRKLCLAVSYL